MSNSLDATGNLGSLSSLYKMYTKCIYMHVAISRDIYMTKRYFESKIELQTLQHNNVMLRRAY